jgi:hypothetical protein
LCNNALLERNEDGIFIGQSTDVALLNVLQLVGVPDRRAVSFIPNLLLSRAKQLNCVL